MSHVLSWAGRVQDGPRTLCQKAGNGDFLICLFILLSFSVYLWLLGSWHFHRLQASYFLKCPSICLSGVASQWNLGSAFWQEYHRSHVEFFSLYPLTWYKIAICFIIDGITFDHLIKILSSRFLHWQSYSFVISKTFMRRYFETMKIFHSSSNFHPLVLVSINVYWH